MNARAPRRSPVAGWEATGGYVTPTAPVWLHDCSWQQRFGCKGPAAGEWLATQGLLVPAPANSWALDARSILVARLATSEFLVEALGTDQQSVAALRDRVMGIKVYPVIRQDAAFVLGGPDARDLLLQTCSYPFAAAVGNTAVMTSMIGVGVTVVPRRIGTDDEYRIWCDPSFGLYLWSTLVEIAQEMGGGAIASDGQESTTLTGES
jgi:sarcosine oxidase, subunit gamma